MNKQELMKALTVVVDEKLTACEVKLKTLSKDADIERKALSVQKNLYGIAKTTIHFAGNADEFPRPFIGQTTNLLKSEDTLRAILKETEGEEQQVLAVYLHNMLFLRNNFLARYKQESVVATDPGKQFEAKLKCAIVEDLMTSYKSTFEAMDGRKDLVI